MLGLEHAGQLPLPIRLPRRLEVGGALVQRVRGQLGDGVVELLPRLRLLEPTHDIGVGVQEILDPSEGFLLVLLLQLHTISQKVDAVKRLRPLRASSPTVVGCVVSVVGSFRTSSQSSPATGASSRGGAE